MENLLRAWHELIGFCFLSLSFFPRSFYSSYLVKNWLYYKLFTNRLVCTAPSAMLDRKPCGMYLKETVVCGIYIRDISWAFIENLVSFWCEFGELLRTTSLIFFVIYMVKLFFPMKS